MSFNAVTDQPAVVSLLRAAIRKNRLPHALLFTGEPGAGQRRVALELARTLLCRHPEDGDACDECQACRQVGKLVHPDLMLLEPVEDSRVIKIEPLRALIARAALKPFQGACKVFVIEPAEAMNEVAQNAFLKTLEEPGGQTIFVLIAYALEGLLPTIRSRTQSFNFIPSKTLPALDGALEGRKMEVLDFILGASLRPGHPPDLGGLERREVVQLLDGVILSLREALLRCAAAADLSGGSMNDRAFGERASRIFTEAELVEMIECLAEFREKIIQSVNLKLALSVLWDTLCVKNST